MMELKASTAIILMITGLVFATLACRQASAVLVTPSIISTPTTALIPTVQPTPADISRLSTIPADAVKMSPADDAWPPIVGPGWSQPVPLDKPINTAGGEDSAFITPDGQTLYFFFTPNVQIPPNEQLFDGVTGIWVAQRSSNNWSVPERVHLATHDKDHLDGCPFVLNNWMIFCSARVGNYGDVDLYTTTRQNNSWTAPQNWGAQINVDYEVGEMYVTSDGQTLYFASPRPGGLGGYDLWMSQKMGDTWAEPINLGLPVNTPGNENRPFISADGQELWFDGDSSQGHPGPAIFRAERQQNGFWGEPEEIISVFAAEPTLTADGRTLYFIHHYFDPNLSQMIEADIYVTTRLEP